jgi:hypothetical protein
MELVYENTWKGSNQPGIEFEVDLLQAPRFPQNSPGNLRGGRHGTTRQRFVIKRKS